MDRLKFGKTYEIRVPDDGDYPAEAKVIAEMVTWWNEGKGMRYRGVERSLTRREATKLRDWLTGLLEEA